MDKPDALVLSISCDFKGRDELELLLYITKRLEELVYDSSELGKYMLMLETLSENRDLKEKLKEAEEMLREIKFEDLPSYEIGFERGIEKGFKKGIEKGFEKKALEDAIIIIEKFNLKVKDVSKELKIPIEVKEIEKRLSKK